MFLTVVIIAAITLASFFSLLVLTNQSRKKADNLLIAWLSVIVFHLIAYYVEVNELYYSPVFEELSGALVFTDGPLLFFYVVVIHNQLKSWRSVPLHFFPFLINLILIPVLVRFDHYALDIGLGFLKVGSLSGYIIVTLNKLKRYNEVVENVYAELESKQMLWLKMILIGLLVIGGTGAMSQLLSEFGLMRIALDGEFIVPVLLAALVYLMCFYGLRQTAIFIEFNASEKQRVVLGKTDTSTKEKYLKTGLKAGDSKLMFKALNEKMVVRKFYLDPELSLHKLAEEMNVSTAQLSQTINQNTGENFYLYINTLRVTEVIKRFQNGEHEKVTLSPIAFSAGFNSKTSFNRAFKKVTDLTPSMFIKQMKAESLKTKPGI